MRLIPPLAALLLITSVAAAQPAQDPNAMPPPPGSEDQGALPPPPAPGAPQAHHRVPMRQRFEQANTTHDGKLTMEQAQAANLKPVIKHFAEIDTDRKGYVTFQDFKAWRHAKRAAKQAAQQTPTQAPPQ